MCILAPVAVATLSTVSANIIHEIGIFLIGLFVSKRVLSSITGWRTDREVVRWHVLILISVLAWNHWLCCSSCLAQHWLSVHISFRMLITSGGKPYACSIFRNDGWWLMSKAFSELMWWIDVCMNYSSMTAQLLFKQGKSVCDFQEFSLLKHDCSFSVPFWYIVEELQKTVLDTYTQFMPLRLSQSVRFCFGFTKTDFFLDSGTLSLSGFVE